ncbi:Ribonuclease H-like protein, partial [Metarhizium brunneum ARSEF 3297]
MDTAGYGFAVFHNGHLVDWGSGQLGRREVFDAEIHGAVEGLRCAVLANLANEPITVSMGNTSVIDCIGATASNSSQAQFRAFQKIGDKYPYQVSVKWCPGHSNIFGNELADLLAKQGANLAVPEHLLSLLPQETGQGSDSRRLPAMVARSRESRLLIARPGRRATKAP